MALKVFAVIVLIFAAMERAAMPKPAPAMKPATEPDTEWEPAAMPEADDGERISRSHAAFRLGFVLLGLVVLNFFPHWLGIWIVSDDE